MQVSLSESKALIEVLRGCGLAPEEVGLAMVNHKSVPANWPVRPGDRLALFPRGYPIFANWLDQRLNV